jgi:hypothetical protein
MKTRPRLVSNRRALVAACCIAALPVLLVAAGGPTEAAVGPDVVVFNLSDIGNYGVSGGYAAYAVGTVSCNRGDTPLNWCNGGGCAPGASSEDHPAIAQNLYRLKDGRFEQIGMSWLKHGFFSTNSFNPACTGAAGGTCQQPPAGGSQLGVGCTDPYGGGLNGSRPLGPRSEVNAATGLFPFPYTNVPTSQVYDQRVKVATTDLDPALNPGALYWAEGQYIANDDAAAGNGLNNASHRRVTVGPAPNFSVTVTGSTVERQPAIYAWKAQDPSVTLVNADVPGPIVERFHVGRKVTDLGGGVWHYEFAVHNLNSDRSARVFNVDFSVPTNFTNVGFKDIEAHSGEPYPGTDWTVSSSGNQLSWSTDTFANDQNANALRWATMFNFWFDADQPPTGATIHTVGLFKPGTPDSVTFTIGDDLFLDGFETGSTSRWTGTGGDWAIDGPAGAHLPIAAD